MVRNNDRTMKGGKKKEKKEEEEKEEEEETKTQGCAVQLNMGMGEEEEDGPQQICYSLDVDCVRIAAAIYSDDLTAEWRAHRRVHKTSSCCCWMCVSSEPQFVQNESTDAEMYVFTLYDTYLVVTFRGTESVQDVAYDLDVRQVSPIKYKDQAAAWDIGRFVDGEFRYWNVEVQQGFMHQYLSLLPRLRATIQKVLDKNRKVSRLVATGHSLGAALAYLFAALDSPHTLSTHKLQNTTLITFGAPRVGNYAFCGLLEDRVTVHRRYVNGHDPVVCVPIAPRFWHYESPTYLKRPWTGLNFLLFNMWCAEDHRMACYLEGMLQDFEYK